MSAEQATENVRARLQRFIASQLPPDAGLRIRDLRRVTGGLSRENWLFDADWTENGAGCDRQLIMRRDPVGSVLETDRRVEYDVLRALEGSALPTPRVFWLDEDGSWLERPAIVMQRYDGLNDHFVLEGGLSRLDETARAGLARTYCETLAALHGFDWRDAGLDAVLPSPGLEGGRAAIAEWGAYLDRQLLSPNPELAEIRAWLEESAPRAAATVLVHGDFKPGNSLLSGGRLQVMLDWETVHLGDPLEDLGWVTNPLRRREHLIPGAWERDDLIGHYERCTGLHADPEALLFWNVFANFKLNAILLTGVRSFVEGRSERPWSDNGMLAGVMFDQLGW